MKRGLSLVETIFSLALLALVLIVVLNLFPSSMATVRVAEQRYRAETLAASVLDDQVSQPFSSLTVGLSQDLAASIYDQVAYRPHLDISAAGTEDPNYLKSVKITVQWTYRGQPRAVIRELWIHHMPGQI